MYRILYKFCIFKVGKIHGPVVYIKCNKLIRPLEIIKHVYNMQVDIVKLFNV
jgi:hypothetical protein